MSKIPFVNKIKNIISKIKAYKNLLIVKLDHISYFVEINESIVQNQLYLLQSGIDIANGVNFIVNFQKKHQSKVITNDSNFQDAESGLISYLYSYLPDKIALDIGANKGDVSESLLKTGFEVYAFEPFLPIYEKLKLRFGDNSNFHALPYAVSSNVGVSEFFIAEDLSDSNNYIDSTLFNSLLNHSSTDDLVFSSTVPVEVKSLKSLHESSEIPERIGLVKIDTEGMDLEVLRGMGDISYDVVIAEFWDHRLPFAKSETLNRLDNMNEEMKRRKYKWNLVIYRKWGDDQASFYCNHSKSVEKSWGNVFYFQDYQIFIEAVNWCSAVLPRTYFSC